MLAFGNTRAAFLNLRKSELHFKNWFHDDGLPQSRIADNAAIQQRWRAAYGDAVQPGLQAVREAGTMPATPTTKDPG